MDKNNAVDEFLGDLKNNDGDGVFEASKENPFENENIAQEEVVQEEVKEKPIPFHKDPKVLKFIEKEVEKRANAFKPQTEEQKFVGDDIDDVLTRIIGNDTPEKVSAIKDFRKVLLEREERGAERALSQLDQRRQAEIQEENDARAELEEGFETIESTFNVDLSSKTPQARKTRNDFIEFIQRIAPKDENGEVSDYPDFEETFKLFQERKKPELNTRNRELASRGMARSGETSTTPKDRDFSWKGVEKAISGMFN